MELTINIKKQSKLLDFLNLIKDIDYIEVKNILENISDIPNEHQIILEKRLQKIDAGEVNFKNWDEIQSNYANKAV